MEFSWKQEFIGPYFYTGTANPREAEKITYPLRAIEVASGNRGTINQCSPEAADAYFRPSGWIYSLRVGFSREQIPSVVIQDKEIQSRYDAENSGPFIPVADSSKGKLMPRAEWPFVGRRAGVKDIRLVYAHRHPALYVQ